MQDEYIKQILTAHVYDVARETPIEKMNFLSKARGNCILVKREDLQDIFSFKIRGAYNKIVQLSAAEKAAGIIAASAGNHAQGVALSARKLGITATIVMPTTTPDIKVLSVQERQAEVILHGATFGEACEHAMALAQSHGYTFIHPYDDPVVIAGQGTIGMEIVQQHAGPLDAVFVPVGGGGLIAGVAVYIKYVRPDIKVIGVEAEDSACLKAAMDSGERTVLSQVGIFADGVAVAQIGEEPFRLAQRFVDDVITVSTDEICAAVKDLFDDTRSIAEPAGALAVAGLKKYIETTNIQGQTLLAIESGANINFDRLRHVAERAELGERREGIMAVTIPEEKGSFKAFCLALEGYNITEFNYRYADEREAHVFVGIQLHGEKNDLADLLTRLCALGYVAEDMTDNELAKLHIRYMVGGRAGGADNEIIYRFEFPECPGALMRFLDNIAERWNISMFHYRNHGAAYGRVLIGLQVPEADKQAFQEFLDTIHYRYYDECGNRAYEYFLR